MGHRPKFYNLKGVSSKKKKKERKKKISSVLWDKQGFFLFFSFFLARIFQIGHTHTQTNHKRKDLEISVY